MARTSSINDPSGTRLSGSSDITPSERTDPTWSPPSEITNLIQSSSLYKEAVQILSSDTRYGTSYLSMLKMIPYSHEIRDQNIWDLAANSLGAASGYEKAVTDAFNAAMDEIRSLMQDYYSFLSKLPVEQVDQLRDAGINAGVTGEGVTPSGMTSPDPSSMVSPDAPQSTYDNQALSNGISSFVEFIGSMANLASVGVNSANLMGLLDVAEREGYNKQEVHDLLLGQNGILTNSPYRVLTPFNTPALQTLADTARAEQRVKSAESGAAAKALNQPLSVNVGTDPDTVSQFEIKSGEDWLTEISRFQIANRFANIMIQNLRSQTDQTYAGALSYLENEYNMTNFAAMSEQSEFTRDFYANRNGSIEGQNETSLSSSLSNLRKYESHIKEVESWLSDYRSGIIDHWGKQLEQRPYLAPFFYKAMFDFGMEDTFYHQSGPAQALKYGMQSLDSIGSFLGHLTGFKKPVRKVGQTTRTSGPSGESVTETTFKYE